jgi:hypothetical protein
MISLPAVFCILVLKAIAINSFLFYFDSQYRIFEILFLIEFPFHNVVFALFHHADYIISGGLMKNTFKVKSASRGLLAFEV